MSFDSHHHVVSRVAVAATMASGCWPGRGRRCQERPENLSCCPTAGQGDGMASLRGRRARGERFYFPLFGEVLVIVVEEHDRAAGDFRGVRDSAQQPLVQAGPPFPYFLT